jgi:hypothetical protein
MVFLIPTYRDFADSARRRTEDTEKTEEGKGRGCVDCGFWRQRDEGGLSCDFPVVLNHADSVNYMEYS